MNLGREKIGTVKSKGKSLVFDLVCSAPFIEIGEAGGLKHRKDINFNSSETIMIRNSLSLKVNDVIIDHNIHDIYLFDYGFNRSAYKHKGNTANYKRIDTKFKLILMLYRLNYISCSLYSWKYRFNSLLFLFVLILNLFKKGSDSL